jgi:hypothetical protein
MELKVLVIELKRLKVYLTPFYLYFLRPPQNKEGI